MSDASPSPILPPHIDTLWLRRFRSRLLLWYRQAGRRLPWRETRDPYAIMVSELMLQQTQAATVIPYYQRFLQRFSTLESLAAAPLDAVLKHWEGLGYYRRARLLHAAAQKIVEEHAGVFPANFEAIADLPGAGRYTAGAIASFAFGQARPIVEANTQRLHARLLKLQKPLSSGQSQKQLWAFAEAILSRKHAAEINHAVMDLGALICRPRQPACLLCPLRSLCPTQRENLQACIPVVAKRPQTVAVHELAVAALDDRQRLWLCQRPEGGWWAGMWDLPRVRCTPAETRTTESSVNQVAKSLGASLTVRETGPAFHYGVTHHKITADLLICDVASDPAAAEAMGENSDQFCLKWEISENCGETTQLDLAPVENRGFTSPGPWKLTDSGVRRGLAMTRSARVICEHLHGRGLLD